jgi:hypothetical protein
MKIMQKIEGNMPVATRTSSEELVDRWASREVPAFVDFFTHVEPRVTMIFLIGALGALGDFTIRSASCEGGSSIAGVSVVGAAAANLFGFSSSLRRKQKLKPFVKVDREKKIVHENKQQNTHESMRSKSSTSSSGAEVSPIIVVCAKVLEERSSVTCFLFLSTPRSTESAGGGDIIELVSSSESLPSSPSWLSSTSGALEAAETGTF